MLSDIDHPQHGYQGRRRPLSARTISDRSSIAAIEAREERIFNILDAVADAILTIDADGRIESFNKAAGRVLGFADAPVPADLAALLPIEARDEVGLVPRLMADMAAGRIGCGRPRTMLRADRSSFSAELSITALQRQGRRLFTLLVRDITVAREAEQKLQRLELFDPLTGLPNRTHLLRRIDAMVAGAMVTKERAVLLLIDLDGFKNVNHMSGYEFGDRLLTAVARRLEAMLVSIEFLARVSGDKFAILAPAADPLAALDLINKRFVEALRQPFVLDGVDVIITASAGALILPDHGDDLTTILRNVENTTYYAKERGRNTLELFSTAVSKRHAGQLQLEMELRKALDRGQLSVHYQPRIAARGGAVIGMEALMRWTHPEFGAVPPIRFIPIAEETGLIQSLGAWVLETACAQTQLWRDQGFDLRLSVNLATQQFCDERLPAAIEAVLARTGLPGAALELEITESGLLFEFDRVVSLLIDLRALDIAIAVDDFGTRYSSLNYIKRLPLDVLKIDRSFIQGVPHETGDVAISTAIVAMSKSLNLRVVAEGVETVEQLDFVESLGCDEVQGYYFSRPLPPKLFSAYLASRRSMSRSPTVS